LCHADVLLIMTDRPSHAGSSFGVPGWSNRLLFLAVGGILFLTLYPFRFDFASPESGNVFPLLLDGWGKDAGQLDAFLNVLLFVPYGFAVSLNLRARGARRATTLALVLAAGAVLSYTVEFLQLYIPQRDSGWEDVLTNSTGAVAGSVLFDLCGPAVIRFLSACERSIDPFATPPRVIVILILYLAICFGATVPLQEAVGLSSWKPNCLFVLGNRVTTHSHSAWKGELSRVELWDHSVSPEFARELTSSGSADLAGPRSLADYDFSGEPPFHDRRGVLPDLDWISKSPVSSGSKGVVLDGESRLVSRATVEAFVDGLRKTNQFSLHVVCTPSQVAGIDGRIFAISDAAPLGDLELSQEENHLVFWFRNSVLLKRPSLAWNHADVFVAQQTRDILISYDGSALSVYIDGKRLRSNYEFGPGSTLAMLVGRGKANEMIGYRYIYYLLIFCPAGCFLGLAWRKLAARPLSRLPLTFLGILLPAVLFEILIVRLSNRPIAPGSVGLSVLLILAGCFWINSDGTAVPASSQLTSGDLAT
jgi:VanZ like family